LLAKGSTSKKRLSLHLQKVPTWSHKVSPQTLCVCLQLFVSPTSEQLAACSSRYSTCGESVKHMLALYATHILSIQLTMALLQFKYDCCTSEKKSGGRGQENDDELESPIFNSVILGHYHLRNSGG
jgi:hypothetical protein